MKKLSLLIAVVFAAFALSSCRKDGGASVSITNKNLVGTWALVQTTIWDDEEGKDVVGDIVEPPFNRNNRIYEDDYNFYDDDNLSYYEELVFTQYSLKSYSWQHDYDDDRLKNFLEWGLDMPEMEYTVRDNAIWVMGVKVSTIEKLTTKELLLDGVDSGISLYRKK